jgi:hypothetical protein
VTVSPDRATFAADVQISLPLFASLTGADLAGGTIRVYRHEPDVQGEEFLPRRRPLVGRIVEVASTHPGMPGIAQATVDPDGGTITFPTRRLGTFQSFIEVPKDEIVILRETFDGATARTGAVGAPLPPGWSVGYTWQVGTPGAMTAVPASAPFLLGTNLTGAAYRDGAAPGDAVTTPPIVVGGAIARGMRVLVRYREWLRLADAGDTLTVEVIRPDGTVAGEIVDAARVGPTVTTGSALVDAAGTAGGFDVTALVGASASFRLRFTFASDGAGSDRGIYLDDVVVVLSR